MTISKILTTTYTMNLLDKLTYRITSGLAFVLIPFFFACDDPSELGLELEIDDSDLQITKLEFVLPASTILIDSLRTDQFQSSIFGQYEDSISGKATVISYNQYNISGGVLPTGDSLEFSRAYLVLKVDALRADNPLSGERMTIHEVKDTLYSQPVYLADRSLDYDPDEFIADFTFDYDPLNDSILHIPLSEAYGQFIYGRLDRGASSGTYQDSLLQGWYHYPPLALVPGVDNAGLYSFDLADDTTRIYIEMATDLGKTYTFRYDFADAHFSEVRRDRSSGKLSDLSSEYQESSVPSSRTYLDMVNGISPKLDLSPFLDFVKANDDFIINRAILTLEAVPEVQFSFVKNVSFIRNFFLKKDGRINGAGVSNGDGFNNAILSEGDYTTSGNSANVLTIPYNSEDSRYSADVTLFTQVLVDNYSINTTFLTEQLVIVSPETISLGRTSFEKSEIKLTVYYTSLKE